ncbi:MAG TPA: agmatine deiminase family protein, partial [Planctomycetota bacterium]|nr:agmatine deiminase family protein [Planctomycetota bacterium]
MIGSERRWPAEWEPHRATWLAWPHNESTWPGVWDRIAERYAYFVRTLRSFEPVHLVVPSRSAVGELAERGDLDGPHPLEVHEIATNDAWIRDWGPIVVEERGERIALDFRFNAWGGKYPPWDADEAAGSEVARLMGARVERVERVLEGGSIDGDGEGTILTTESCLLAPTRPPVLEKREMEDLLSRTLGARRVLWLGDGIAGDDTDGHIDDITRFVAPGVVVTAVEPDPRDPNHEPLEENRARLETLTDARGRRLRVIPIPMPAPVVSPSGDRLPASYVNFLIVNGGVLVPTFDDSKDTEALEALAKVFPGRRVAPVPCRELVVGLGGVHCLSMQ